MNFKKILTFAIALTLTATPQTVNAEIKTKHLWYATGALTTATIVGFADAYYGDCEVLHKEPSFREFVFYVGRFAKNIASQKETRSVAMQQHPLLTGAVAATVLTGLSSAGKTTYDYFNKETKEQKPEDQTPEEQKSEEQKSEEQKAKEELLKELNALEAITPEKDATESASEFAEITTIEKLGSPTAKTDAQKAELKVEHDKKRAEQKALFDALSKEDQEKQLAEQKLKRAEQKEAQSKERERRAQV